jgi:hypothetical protein
MRISFRRAARCLDCKELRRVDVSGRETGDAFLSVRPCACGGLKCEAVIVKRVGPYEQISNGLARRERE